VITFKGTIEVTGSPGDTLIKYKFLRSDEARDTNKRELHFLAPGGIQEVSTTWTLPDSQAERGFTGWEAINITSPTYVVSNKANFVLSSATTTGGTPPSPSPQEEKYRLLLKPQPVWSGPIPYASTFPEMGHIDNGRLVKITNPNDFAICLLLPGHWSTEGCTSNATIILGHDQDTTPQNLEKLFGSSNPSLPIRLVALKTAGNATDPLPVLITYTQTS
jgi:hypothetical protein